MELDDLLKPIVAASPPRILTIDIERIKGRALVEFFDLSDFKNRRIHADDVTSWPRTICAAWRWYGSKRVEFAAEWEDGGRDGMLRRLWETYNQADIVVGHNVQAFDTRKLNGEWWTALHLPPPSPCKFVDTLKVARARFGMESNTLDAICVRLGLPGKVDKYDPAVARAAVDGDKAAQRRLRRYNVGDVESSEMLYDAIRPWIPSHPHIGLWTGVEDSCGHCGSDRLEPSGWARTAVTAYAQYRCRSCGAWYRRTHVKARTVTRPAA